VLDLLRNWFKPGYVISFGTFHGTVNDNNTSVLGSAPGFANEAGQDYHLASGSACVNMGIALNAAVLPVNDVVRQYVKHQGNEVRPNDGQLDIGAFELAGGPPADLVITTTSLSNGTAGAAYSATVAATGGLTPYVWSIASGGLPAGLSLNAQTGVISGTPTTAGTSNFTVQVTDAQNPADSDTPGAFADNQSARAAQHHHNQPTGRAPQSQLQSNVAGHRRSQALHLVTRSGHIAAGVVAHRLDRRDQRHANYARHVELHSSCARQPSASG
jgi:hypothetical protein